jgi:hypothetical protein
MQLRREMLGMSISIKGISLSRWKYENGRWHLRESGTVAIALSYMR